MFWFMLQVDPNQSYLNLKIDPPVPKAGSSGNATEIYRDTFVSES